MRRARSVFWKARRSRKMLIERAVELEMPAMALLDRNGVYGAARFHTSAKRNGVRAHIGAEIAVSSFGARLTPACVASASVRDRAGAAGPAVRVAGGAIRIFASL